MTDGAPDRASTASARTRPSQEPASLVWPPSAEDLDAVEVIRLDGEPVSIPPVSRPDRVHESPLPGTRAPVIDNADAGVKPAERVAERRVLDHQVAGVRIPEGVPVAIDDRDSEGMAWPPPEADEATISILDLEAQAAATPLGPPASRRKRAVEVASDRPARPASVTRADGHSVAATTFAAAVREAERRQTGEKPFATAPALFSASVQQDRSPLVSVLIAAALVIAIGVASYALVRYFSSEPGPGRPGSLLQEQGQPGAVRPPIGIET